MALIVSEDILTGLNEVHSALDQAITALTPLLAEADPGMAPPLRALLARTLLHPFTVHRAAVEQLQGALAEDRLAPGGPCAPGPGHVHAARARHGSTV